MLYPVIIRGPCQDVVREDPAMLRGRIPVILQGPSHDVVRAIPQHVTDRTTIGHYGWCETCVSAADLLSVFAVPLFSSACGALCHLCGLQVSARVAALPFVCYDTSRVWIPYSVSAWKRRTISHVDTAGLWGYPLQPWSIMCPCRVCNRVVGDDDDGIYCEVCSNWTQSMCRHG